MAADYSHKFGRVTISGDCFGGAEHWSTGFQIGNEDSDVTEIVPGAAAAIAVHWRAFFVNNTYHIPFTYRTLQVKVALINTDGTTDEDNIDYHTLSPVATGNSPDNAMPPQITVAATITSQYQRGLAAKGRMYLPGVARVVDTNTGRIPGDVTGAIANGVKVFLDAVNDDVAVPGLVIIASKGHKTAALDANNQPVYVDGRNAKATGCRIGNVYDTQRRRRNELGEIYSTAVLDAA